MDDDAGVRDSLAWLVGSMRLAARTFATADEFLDQYDPAHPGCLVVDVRLPGMSGLQLQQELAARGARLPIVLMTGYAEVAMAVQAMKRGAVDFVEKPVEQQAMMESIRRSLRIDRDGRVLDGVRADLSERLARLTGRQRDVLRLVVAGRPNKVIAADLQLSAKTVEVHRTQVMKKLGVGSLAELVRLVLQYAPELCDDAEG